MIKWGSLYLAGFAAVLTGFITGIKFWSVITPIHLSGIIFVRIGIISIIFYLLGRMVGWIFRRYVPELIDVFTRAEEIVEAKPVEQGASLIEDEGVPSSPLGDVVMEGKI